MSKKFGKFILFSAIAGAAAAGAYYFLQNKKLREDDSMDDYDLDDFGDDTEDTSYEEEGSRNYVDLNLDKAETAAASCADQLKDTASKAFGEASGEVKDAAKEIKAAAADMAAGAKDAAMDAAEAAGSKVEEFFDDDDDTSDSL